MARTVAERYRLVSLPSASAMAAFRAVKSSGSGAYSLSTYRVMWEHAPSFMKAKGSFASRWVRPPGMSKPLASPPTRPA